MEPNQIQKFVSQFNNVDELWNELEQSKKNNYETYNIIKYVIENKSFEDLKFFPEWFEYVNGDLASFLLPNEDIIDIINDIELESQSLLPYFSGLSFSERILVNDAIYKANKDQIIEFYKTKLSEYKSKDFNERLINGNSKLEYSLVFEYLENRISSLTDLTYHQDVIIPYKLEESRKIILIKELNLHDYIRSQLSSTIEAKDIDVITIIALLTDMKPNTVKRAMTYLKVSGHLRNEKNNPFKNEETVFKMKELISDIKIKYK